MSNQTSNALAPINEVRGAIEKMAPQFKAALPAHIPAERFVRAIVTAVQMNADLLNADRRTLYSASMRAAEQGLLPNGREGAIVTFGGKAQFMPMIGGILKLARNSGEIASIDAQVKYKNDKFTYRPGIDKVPQFEPDWFGDRGELDGVYAVAITKDGAAYVEIMNKKQIEQVRNVSRSANAGPWKTWYDEMARKTVLRRLAKRLPLSTDLDEVLREDDDIFMPPAEAPAAAQEQRTDDAAPAKDAPRTRPSRLNTVAAAAAAEPVTIDGDGVVIEPGEYPPMPENFDQSQHDDSPI